MNSKLYTSTLVLILLLGLVHAGDKTATKPEKPVEFDYPASWTIVESSSDRTVLQSTAPDAVVIFHTERVHYWTTLEDLADSALNAGEHMKNFKLIEKTPVKIKEGDALRVAFECEEEGKQAAIVSYITLKGRFAYKVEGFSSKAAYAKHVKDVDVIADSLKINHPPTGPNQIISNKELGFQLQLSDAWDLVNQKRCASEAVLELRDYSVIFRIIVADNVNDDSLESIAKIKDFDVTHKVENYKLLKEEKVKLGDGNAIRKTYTYDKEHGSLHHSGVDYYIVNHPRAYLIRVFSSPDGLEKQSAEIEKVLKSFKLLEKK